MNTIADWMYENKLTVQAVATGTGLDEETVRVLTGDDR